MSDSIKTDFSKLDFYDVITENLQNSHSALRSGLGLLYSKYNYNIPDLNITYNKSDMYPVGWFRENESETFYPKEYIQLLSTIPYKDNDDLANHLINYYRISNSITQIYLDSCITLAADEQNVLRKLQSIRKEIETRGISRASLESMIMFVENLISDAKKAELILDLRNLLFGFRLIAVLPKEVLDSAPVSS